MSIEQPHTTPLFGMLPDDPAPLAADDAAFLASLPIYGTVQEVLAKDEPTCLRLERRGMVKVHRWKTDPIALRPSLHVGRLP